MTRSKNSTKLLALLMSLVLITSCFVGGTLARYITSTSSEDSARVAVWGINADEVEMDLFDAQYELDGTVVAKANNGDNIIAPGTGKMSKFSIVNLDDTLAPEVMYEIRIDLDDTEIDQRILDNPSIQWKLDNNNWGTWEDTKANILALSGDASGVKTYQALEIAEQFANGVEHTIAWQWLLDDNNAQDTAMGNAAVTEDITTKIVVRITAQQTDGTTQNYTVVNLPNDFIDAPITLMSNGTSYTAEHDFNQYIYNTNIYVDKDNGSDTTGDGSENNPYKTIKKATSMISSDTNIYVKSSTPFMRNENFPENYSPNYNVSFFNNNEDNSQIVSVTAQKGLTWTTHDNIFVTTRSSTKSVMYKDNTNATFGYSNLTQTTNLEECKNTTGSYFIDGDLVYVNTFDGNIPTDETYLVCLGGTGMNAFRIKNNITLYIDGFTFLTPGHGALFNPEDGSTNTKVVLKDCITGQNDSYSSPNADLNGFKFQNIKQIILFNCTAINCDSDGFNYHFPGHPSSSDCLVIEVNCQAFNCGLNASSNTHNLSSCHDGARIIRVNHYGRNSNGPMIIDINNCKSLNFGCDVGESELAKYSYQFSLSDNGYSLLAGCKTDGSEIYGTSTTTGTLYLYDFTGEIINTPNAQYLTTLDEISLI